MLGLRCNQIGRLAKFGLFNDGVHVGGGFLRRGVNTWQFPHTDAMMSTILPLRFVRGQHCSLLA